MPRVIHNPLLEMLLAVGEQAPPVEDKLRILEHMRQRPAEFGIEADRFMLEQLDQARRALVEAQGNLEQAKVVLETLTRTPWFPGIYVGSVETPLGPYYVVVHGNARRLVGLSDGVDPASLRPGTEVFLGNQLNVIMSVSPWGIPACGETAHFDRYTPDGRMVIKSRDEEFVVEQADELRGLELKPSDIVRWDRSAWMAFEKIDPEDASRYLLDEIPNVGRDRIGGQDANLDKLLTTLTAKLVNPDLAKKYGLSCKRSILMVGPPGCGKTLMAKIAATEVSRLSGKTCRFSAVKPAEWESPWVGETQQNIRHRFKALHDASQDGFAVVFIDEIEAVGRIRGSSLGGQHSDKFLAALLAELDGFGSRGNVAVISATNRKDLCDPALLERLSDVEIQVGRPDMRGAGAVFEVHLPSHLPYSPNGRSAPETRREIIDTAVSRFYSPNAGNELCVLKFRDNKVRTVCARELASGRLFEQICESAKDSAFMRAAAGGDEGICVLDMENAVSNAIDRLTSTLSKSNVHAHLSDLPQDVDVVSVEPIARRVSQPHRYISLA